MSTKGLDGASVLVTRPSPHGEALSEAIRQLGGEPVLFPGVRIEPAGKKDVISMLATIEKRCCRN